MQTFRVVHAGLLLLVMGVIDATFAQDARSIERGRVLYLAHCAVCHGDGGQGDGPQSKDLTTIVPDLTKLSARHERRFPHDTVYQAIDGKRLPAGHSAREMPVWGLSLREIGSDADQEDMVRGRILQLMLYLESIQSLPPNPQPGAKP